MIYDIFPFFNELDVLEIRLNELDSYVDKFVIIESDNTITLHPKHRLFYDAQNEPQFKKFKDKIIYFPYTYQKVPADVQFQTDYLNLFDPIHWLRLEQMFHNVWTFLEKSLTVNDICIVSNADEIPRGTVVNKYAKTLKDEVIGFEQECYWYWINCLCLDPGNQPWHGSIMFRYRPNVSIGESMTSIKRLSRINTPNSGWHFCYMVPITRIQEKISTSPHQEFNLLTILDTERLSKVINNLEQHGLIFNTQDEKYVEAYGDKPWVKFVKLQNSLPKYILENLGKFDYLVKHGDF